MKLAPEGYPFVLIFLLLTAIAVVLAFVTTPKIGHIAELMALILVFLTCFMLYFFRDPDRISPARADAFVSPADGRILLVRDVDEPVYCKGARKQISIFMSPFNVHVNRAPCDGTVRDVQHHHGKYLAAYRDDASLKNENTEMALDGRFGTILVRQVAGYIARRTVCRVKPGEQLSQGQRFGIIKFSSRVDVYLPATCHVQVKPGDRVLAGKTILAIMPPAP